MSQHHARQRPQSFYRTKTKTLDALGKLLRSVQKAMDDIVEDPTSDEQQVTLAVITGDCNGFIERIQEIKEEERL